MGAKVQMYRIAACKLGAKVQMYRNTPSQNGRKGTWYQNAPSQSGRNGTGNEGTARRQRKAMYLLDGGGREGNGKDALAEEGRANGKDRRTDKAAGSWSSRAGTPRDPHPLAVEGNLVTNFFLFSLLVLSQASVFYILGGL